MKDFNSKFYDSELIIFFNVVLDDHNINGLSQHVPVHFPSNHSSQSDRISASVKYSIPEFQLNQFERNPCLYKATTNQEYYLCNQR